MGHLSTKELIYFGAMLLYSQGESLYTAVEHARDMFNAVFEEKEEQEKEEPAKDKTIEISDDEILSSVENDSSTVWANYIIKNNGLYKNVAYAETFEDALEIKKRLENQGFEVEVNYAPKCKKLWE